MLRRHVLILHQGALGDFIVTWPFVLGLARSMPQMRVVVVTHAQKGKLAERVLGVESSDIEQGWHALHAADADPTEPVSRLLGSARLIYSFISSGDDAVASNLARLAPDAERVFLQPRPPADFDGHVCDYLLQQLKSRPLESGFTASMLRSISERGLLPGRSVAANAAVCIHPGSGSQKKNWPIERFVDLAVALQSSGRQVRFVLGEAERERLAAREIDQLRSCAECDEPATLVALLQTLLGASAYVGNDSGPSHLAGIVGIPSVVLFGRNPKFWKPLGPTVRTLHAEPIGAITVADVLAALRS
jgi:ADP-heptose:LPS heptosyltransferase